MNKERAEVLGWLIWDNLFRISPAEDQTLARYEQLKSEWTIYFQTGQHPTLNQEFEVEIQRPDGLRRTLQTARFSIKTEHGFLLGSIIRDVTERKQVERIEAAQWAVSHILARSPETATALRQVLGPGPANRPVPGPQTG